MKKNIFLALILLSVLLICSAIWLVGCNKTTQTPSGNDPDNTSSSKFSLSTDWENCRIEGDKVHITVSNSTQSVSLINAFSIPETYKWELHYDRACLPSLTIVSKSVDLDEGDNILYALFINNNNADDIYLYEIIVHRVYEAELRYCLVSPHGTTQSIQIQRISTKQDYSLTYIPPDYFFDVGYGFSHYENEHGDIVTSVNISKTTEVFIVQKANSYVITLDVKGGKSLSNNQITVIYGDSYALPIPTKDDHAFAGWYTSDNTLIQSSGKWNIAGDITLNASWINEYETYTGSLGDEFLGTLLNTTPKIKTETNSYGETQTVYSVYFELKPSFLASIQELKSWNLTIELGIRVFVQYYDIRGRYQTCELTLYTSLGALAVDHYYKYSCDLGTWATPSSMQVHLQQEKGLGCTLIEYATDGFSYTYRVSGTITYKP